MFKAIKNDDKNNYDDIICETSKYVDTDKLSSINNKFCNDFKEAYKSITNEGEKLVISLSGGVDSMLCLYIAKFMGYDVNAFMINYLNRETSEHEQEFVTWWCNKLNVDLFIYRIDNLRRERYSNVRSDYEEQTKQIRFSCYKSFNCKVILGHNRDDCIENIFSNLKKSRSYHNLKGMTHISNINDVDILRPFLDITKSDIINCANMLNIPYLYDSTPEWSERGQLRDILIPNIYSFNKNIIPNLLSYTHEMSDLFELLNNEINKLNIVNETNVTYISGNIRNIKIFWRLLFNNLNINVNNKCIEQLIQNYEKLVLKKSRYVLGKMINMKIHNYNLLEINYNFEY